MRCLALVMQLRGTAASGLLGARGVIDSPILAMESPGRLPHLEIARLPHPVSRLHGAATFGLPLELEQIQ